MSLAIKREVFFRPSVRELAGVFASLSDKEQADFFHFCKQEFSLFQGDFQLCNMSKHLSPEATEFLLGLAAWAKEPYEEEVKGGEEECRGKVQR